jgi:tetratricopeptide (TPR) repeat protein
MQPSPPQCEAVARPRRVSRVALLLQVLALIYALLAGLKTVVDFDLGWQMATARYIWSHHTIPSTDVFSYTVPGTPWIYPVLPGMIFLLAYKVGGYALISWVCAVSTAATVLFLATGRNARNAALALIAVPVIAENMIPRSGMFTVVLSAAFARVILDYFETGRSKLWFLPVLMIIWVNCHFGFLAGIVLIAVYVVLEVLEWPFAARRSGSVGRLESAWLWLLASLAATLVNPWGWRIWSALWQQEFPTIMELGVIQEFGPLQATANWSEWRNPDNTVYWLIGFALIAAAAAIWRKRIGSAVVLLIAIYAVQAHSRVGGVFAAVVCLLGGTELSAAAGRIARGTLAAHQGVRRIATAATVCVAGTLVLLRCTDLATNRFYLSAGQYALFGAGASWWLPERATTFLVDKHLPREVFSTFNLSSYLVWRLGEKYPDFGDGRYLPFGDDVLSEQRALARQPLDSPAWEQAVSTRHIQTVIFPVVHFFALSDIPLKEDCSSIRWKLLYIDTSAVIFVRRDALTGPLQSIPDISCESIAQSLAPGRTVAMRDRAEHYQQLMTVAAVQYVLGGLPEATATLSRAAAISHVDPMLYVQKGEIEMAGQRYDQAEEEFRASLAHMPTEPAWHGLGLLYIAERRYADAIVAFQHSTKLAGLERYLRLYDLGKAYVLAHQPEKALETLAAVRASNPYIGSSTPEAAEFRAQVDEATATAYASMGQWSEAIVHQKNAVDETPRNARRWQVLAYCYGAAGRANESTEAQRRSEALQSGEAH